MRKANIARMLSSFDFNFETGHDDMARMIGESLEEMYFSSKNCISKENLNRIERVIMILKTDLNAVSIENDIIGETYDFTNKNIVFEIRG